MPCHVPSIIRPAAFCGAVGFKPSYGTLHRAGMKVMSESLDTIGVITRSVGDAALVMGGLTGRDHGRPEARPGTAPRLADTVGLSPHVLDTVLDADFVVPPSDPEAVRSQYRALVGQPASHEEFLDRYPAHRNNVEFLTSLAG